MYALLILALACLFFGFFTTAKFLIFVAVVLVLFAFLFPGY